MRTPTISVIIPCYNPKNYIKQCVRSVLRQTFKDIEVIVVDDGSTDSANFRCVEKMSQKDSRLRIIRNSHQGVGPTRKEGFLQARGEYIFFVDCDDFLPKEALEILYQAAIGSGADVTIGNYVRVADSFGLTRIKRIMSDYDTAEELIQKDDILKACFIPFDVATIMYCRLYKTSLIKQAIRESGKELFTSFKLEDCYFNLLIIPYISSIYLTNKICYYYRFGGITTTYSFRQKSNADYFNCRFDQFEKWNFQEGHLYTFASFAYTLYWDLKILLLSEKYGKDEIVAYLEGQLSSIKIVDWARKNIKQLDSLPCHYKKLMTEKPEDICRWYSNALHSKRSRIRRVCKKCALACFKVLDIIYEVLY